jgi:beta-N-acetylhexosaminidase
VEIDPLEEYVNAMTLEERVGQLFLARCPDRNAAEDAARYHLGGYVLFARDFKNETKDSVTHTITNYQDHVPIPLLIAVDEEGGTVNRVSRYPAFRSEPFSSPRKLFDNGGMEAVLAAEAEKGQLLASLGINVNLAPVCDITTNPDAFMYKRSLGQPPEITGEFATKALDALKNHGVGGVLKHFPGYGNNTDTHIGIAIDNRSLEELESRDLMPFQIAIDGGCGAIMVSHTIITAIDDKKPATLSPAVNAYLRQDMGFDGVVVTDDLVMQAITDGYGAGDAAVLAVLAGNDLLCSTEYKTQYQAVLDAAQSGRIPQERINESVMRILRWKLDMGIWKIGAAH